MANKMGDSTAILYECFFCNESDEYVATNKPKGTKIIKYLACRKLTGMKPSDRY